MRWGCSVLLKVAILGCGWVGSALKERLKTLGYEVNCLSRDVGMDTLDGLYACDVFVIATPPSSKGYFDAIANAYISLSLNNAITPQVIFLSSISFYNDKKIVVEAEKLVKRKDKKRVVLRLGGLMGYDRIAGKYTAGKTIENKITNYVHRDDVIGIIETIIEQKVTNKIFDVVAPIQSSRKEIFLQNSKQFNFAETKFSKNISTTKEFSSEILCEILGYKFKKEDVREFW